MKHSWEASPESFFCSSRSNFAADFVGAGYCLSVSSPSSACKRSSGSAIEAQKTTTDAESEWLGRPASKFNDPWRGVDGCVTGLGKKIITPQNPGQLAWFRLPGTGISIPVSCVIFPVLGNFVRTFWWFSRLYGSSCNVRSERDSLPALDTGLYPRPARALGTNQVPARM